VLPLPLPPLGLLPAHLLLFLLLIGLPLQLEIAV
jgi:hypothetical protein